MTDGELRQLSDKVEKGKKLIEQMHNLSKNISKLKSSWNIEYFQDTFLSLNKESFIKFLECELASLNIEFDKL